MLLIKGHWPEPGSPAGLEHAQGLSCCIGKLTMSEWVATKIDSFVKYSIILKKNFILLFQMKYSVLSDV